jgi:hypothetical protein
MLEYQTLLRAYNPWWEPSEAAFSGLPTFHRPIFDILMDDLKGIPQILSITGPRRIGKSTILKQMIQRLLSVGTPPQKILYYSFDDPALIARGIHVDQFIDFIMETAKSDNQNGKTYMFFDEIQRLERWELYLKKYYDLNYPVRMVLSGSASSPIFKKSRESLLGRVKDYHLLPFSFREYLLYQYRDNNAVLEELNKYYQLGKVLQGFLTGDPNTKPLTTFKPSISFALTQPDLINQLNDYLMKGGFPEVWSLPSWIAIQDYLYDNQVKKVIYEDLVLAAEFRKPELLKQFYISLLETPGQEVNVQSMAQDANIAASQIDKYLPLLEMTDLIYHVSKFRRKPLRVRKGHMKFYLVDMALRNAVLKLGESLLQDQKTLGLYAENLVFLALKKWRGTIQLDYYRERDVEVDFIIHVGPQTYVPVEVKYQNTINPDNFKGLKNFMKKNKRTPIGVVVTKDFYDWKPDEEILAIPLFFFLIMFD